MRSPAKSPKILILYANTGGGHLSAAKALQAAIELRHPGQYQVDIVNIALVSGSQRVQMLYESYNLMLKADPRFAKHGMRLLNSINVEKMIIPLVRRSYSERSPHGRIGTARPDRLRAPHPQPRGRPRFCAI